MKSSHTSTTKRIQRSGQSGMALVYVVLGIGALSLLMVVWAKTATISLKEVAMMEVQGEIEALKRNLTLQADCPATLASPDCATNVFKPVDLQDKASVAIIEKAGTDMNGFTVRVQCKTQGASQVMQLLLTSKNQNNPAAVTDKPITFSCSAPPASGSANCSLLGGVWQASTSQCSLKTGGIYVLDDTDGSVDRSQVLQCDVKETGSSSDLRTCNRRDPAGDNGTCVYTSGNGNPNNGGIVGGAGARWIYKTNGANGYKECIGGIYADEST